MYNKNTSILKIIDNLMFPSLINNASKDKELILLDDNSPLKKETEKIVKKYESKLKNKFGSYKLIKNEKNLGFAGSYNKGVKLAKGNSVLISNDDVYFPRNSIDSLFNTLNKNKSIGMVVPLTNSAYGFHNTLIFEKMKNYSKDEIKRIEEFSNSIKKVMSGKTYELNTNDGITGFCIAVKKEVIKETGYFDTKFSYATFEDTDLFYRVIKNNNKIVLDASTFIEHGGIKKGSNSIMQHPIIVTKSYVSNGIRYFVKWKDYKGIIGVTVLGVIRHYDLGLTITKDIKKRAEEKGISLK